MIEIAIAAGNCRNSRQGHLLKTACKASLIRAALLTSLSKQPHIVRMKGKTELVTVADLTAEAAITASLQEDTHGITLLAEESAKNHTGELEGQLSIADPLNGTTNFAHGFPCFAVSIALFDHERPLVCAIYSPCMDELFYACTGNGAWLNGEPIKVTPTCQLIESLIGTGFPYDITRHLPELISQLQTALPQVRDMRRAGAAALDLVYVNCGRLDGFYERDLQPWDTAADWLLVEEAGARVSDYTDKPFSALTTEIIATKSSLHHNCCPCLHDH